MYGVQIFQLRCIKTFIVKAVLREAIEKANLMKEERRLTSPNLVLVLVHDLLLARGIQAGDGPIKQAILRHKTRLNGEFQKIKIKRGATSSDQLAQNEGEQAGSPSHTSPAVTLSDPLCSAVTPICASQYMPWKSRRSCEILYLSRFFSWESILV